MIITIVGAPETKEDVVWKIHEHTGISATGGRFPDTDVGFTADYRTELWLASERSISTHTIDRIFWHSLIDSAAYASLRLMSLVQYDPTNIHTQTWMFIVALIGQMLLDGFQSDHTLYIPYTGEDEDFQDLDAMLVEIMDATKIPYVQIDPEDDVEKWLNLSDSPS